MNLENKIEAQRKRMELEKNKLDTLMKKAKMEQRKADNHRKIVVGANFETFLNEPRRYSEEQTRRIMQVAFATREVKNCMEQIERELARSLKYSLPNEWDEATARQVMECFIKEQFVDKGMCADYGIHRSYNDKGQPNLHIHILLTLRPLNEDGTWGAKSRKEYVLDADGNRIPNASGKGYKSRKVNVIDWNEKGKAKEWRNAIAEVINATNEKAGIAERVDPRSYKDRGIPLIPTIHLGERASALERKGMEE